MSASAVLILGVGSAFGADQIGWHAVNALARGDLGEQFPRLTIDFRQSDRPGSALLSLLQGHSCAIIVDAMRAGGVVGTVRRFLPDELPAESGLLSSHGFGVSDALALGRALGQLPAQMVIYGLEVGADLASTAVPAGTIDQLHECVVADLQGWQSGETACA